MKLSDIHLNYKTDKGNGHNYIDTYENLFSGIRKNNLNILEIGVLLGGSLKMWEHYFENSMIYGVDDFSQLTTNEDFGGEPVNTEEIKIDLSKHERIKFIECNSRSNVDVEEKVKSLNVEFEVIIDDGEHSLPCQIDNFNNFIHFLSESGVYIVEDCENMNKAQELKEYILDHYDGLNVNIIPLDIQNREDDILVIIN